MLPSGDSEDILREQDLTFRTVYYLDGSGHVCGEERKPIHTLNQSFQLLDRKGLPPLPASHTHWSSGAIIPETESDLPIREYILRTVSKDEIRGYSRCSQQDTQGAAENVLSDLSITGSAEVEGGLQNAPYKFLETVLTDGTYQYGLGGSFGLNI